MSDVIIERTALYMLMLIEQIQKKYNKKNYLTNLVILFTAALPQLIMMVVLIAIVIGLLTLWYIFWAHKFSQRPRSFVGLGKPVKETNIY